MYHRPNFGKYQLLIRNLQRSTDKLRRVPTSPNVRMKVVTDLEAPAWIKWVLIQSTPSYNPVVIAGYGDPWRTTISSSAPFMDHYSALALPQGFIDVGELHRFGIAHKLEKRCDIRTTRRA